MESDWRYDVAAEGFNAWGATKVARRLLVTPSSWVSDEPGPTPELCVIYYNVDPSFHPPFGDIYYKLGLLKPLGPFAPFPYGIVTKPDR